MTTLPKSGATELASGQAVPETTVNEALRALDAGHSRAIIEDRYLTAPPGSCADGAAYLVAASPTGDWSGKAGKLAVAAGANASNGWTFQTVAVEGFRLYVRDENLEIQYDGGWNPVADGTLETVTILLSDPNGSDITTGDGKAYYPVPATLAGLDLIDARAVLDTAGTGGGFLMQLRRKRSGSDVDMLSTRVSIDSGENDSEDATAPPVINTSNDDVTLGDRIYFDLDGVPTGAKGLVAELTFG